MSTFMTAKNKTSNRKRSRPIEIKKNYPNNKTIGLILIIIAIVVISAVFIFNKEEKENSIAVIDTSMGTIKVELFEDKVPDTCKNFINYANEGFYDGLVFHRVVDDFVIQGGGFYPNGTKKQTKDPIPLEINEDIHHVDGAIAMARTSDPDSATSQFFINDGPQSSLEPGGVDEYGYAVFGVVIEGIEVVRSIASVETGNRDYMANWPINDIIIYSINIEN